MKEFFGKYGKTILLSLLGLAVLFVLFKGGTAIYKNSYSHEKYQYTLKSFQNQVFDQNVNIAKNIKHNGKQGEFKMSFTKKDLAEEYVIPIDKSNNSGSVEFSIEGKVGAGDVNIRMVDDQNKDVFNKTVKGANIKEVSTQDYTSTLYKFVITPNGALDGDLTIEYKIK